MTRQSAEVYFGGRNCKGRKDNLRLWNEEASESLESCCSSDIVTTVQEGCLVESQFTLVV